MNIGDSLTTKEFNKIIYLLRQNRQISESITLGTDVIESVIGNLDITITGGEFTDTGILVSNTDGLDLTIKLSDKVLHFGVPYLRLTVYTVDNYHEETEASKIKTSQLDVKLYPTTNKHVNGLTGDRVKIIGYDAEVYLDLSSSDYEYITGLRLYPSASKYLIVEDETVDLISEAMSSLNKPLRRDATIKFYELFDYASMEITADNELIVDEETDDITVVVKDTDGSRIEGAVVKFYEIEDEVVPVVDSVSLTGDKSVLSYYDEDTLVLSATVLDEDANPMEGESVVFKQGSTTLGTVQTGSDGVAQYTYASQGIGDTGFTAEVGSLVSETYRVEDCIFYHGDAISYTGTSTSDTVYSLGYDEIADLSSTDFEFSWKFHQTSRGADVCLGASSEFSVSPVKSNYRVYLGGNDSGVGRYGYRTTSSSTSTSGTVYANTVYDMKITRNSDTFSYYLDNTLLGTKTASFFSNYNMFGIHTVQWNKGTTTISEIKIKPL